MCCVCQRELTTQKEKEGKILLAWSGRVLEIFLIVGQSVSLRWGPGGDSLGGGNPARATTSQSVEDGKSGKKRIEHRRDSFPQRKRRLL